MHFVRNCRTCCVLPCILASVIAPTSSFACRNSSQPQQAFQAAAIPAQASTPAPHIAPDNSRQNVLSISTADDQPNDRADRLTAAHIRKAIYSDKTLSVYAHNVKIIVVRGQVTLEGPVHSQSERLQVASDAATIVRPQSISNKLTVA